MAQKHCATCTCDLTEQRRYSYLEENVITVDQDVAADNINEEEAESSSDVELIEEKHPIIEVSSDSEGDEEKQMNMVVPDDDEMSDVLSLDVDVENISVVDPDDFSL